MKYNMHKENGNKKKNLGKITKNRRIDLWKGFEKMNGKVYTVTLNPAIDRVLYLNKFIPDITNRLTGIKECVGGKGTHVSQNLKFLGLDSIATGIVHGQTGKKVIKLLEEDGVQTLFQYHECRDTRTNYLMIESTGRSTCLSEKGVQLTDKDIEEFLEFLKKEIQDGDFLVLSGDASNCPDPYVYNKVIKALADKKVKIFLDASGETLKRCVEESPYMIKPNQDELEFLTGIQIQTIDDLKRAVRELDKYEIPIVAVSLGGNGSLVRVYDRFFRVYSPKVNVRNTIGCGDCFLSGLIYGCYKEMGIEETLQIATAASAATAESNVSVGFDKERFEELKKQVIIEIY